MKRIIALILLCLISLTGCSNKEWETDKTELETAVNELNIEKISEIYEKYENKNSQLNEINTSSMQG